MHYWYNIATGRVESDDDRGPAEDVLGPYDTPEEAGLALKIARAKTDKWDAEDRAWEARGASGAAGEDDQGS